MLLAATIALAAQVSTAAPARTAPARPCEDPSLLCRISPYFCPGTYPSGLEPCWPTDSRAPRNLPNRPSPSAASGSAASAGKAIGEVSGKHPSRTVVRP